MDALLRFAPAYFEYMSKAIFHGVDPTPDSIRRSFLTLALLQLPTILAKIFGFYRIGLRNPATGKVMRLDVLVMEVSCSSLLTSTRLTLYLHRTSSTSDSSLKSSISKARLATGTLQ